MQKYLQVVKKAMKILGKTERMKPYNWFVRPYYNFKVEFSRTLLEKIAKKVCESTELNTFRTLVAVEVDNVKYIWISGCC